MEIFQITLHEIDSFCNQKSREIKDNGMNVVGQYKKILDNEEFLSFNEFLTQSYSKTSYDFTKI